MKSDKKKKRYMGNRLRHRERVPMEKEMKRGRVERDGDRWRREFCGTRG